MKKVNQDRAKKVSIRIIKSSYDKMAGLMLRDENIQTHLKKIENASGHFQEDPEAHGYALALNDFQKLATHIATSAVKQSNKEKNEKPSGTILSSNGKPLKSSS